MMCSIVCNLCAFCGEGFQFSPPSVLGVVCWLNGTGLDTSGLIGMENLLLIINLLKGNHKMEIYMYIVSFNMIARQ